MTYQLQLLGRFQLLSPSGAAVGIPSKKTQALIALLALADGESVPRGRLTGLLWADRGEDQARSSLRQAFTALRKTFGEADGFPFRIDDDTASIDLGAIKTDVQDFTESIDQNDVLDLWRGELLEGLSIPDQAVQDWLLAERQRLRTLYIDGLSREIARLEGAGDHREAQALAQRLLIADPLHEPAHRTVMGAYMAAGDRTKALRHYRAFKDRLERDLGVGPEPETEKLYGQLTAGHPVAAPAAERPGHSDITDDKPTIAVLPFANLSGDPGQDYFSDGMTENIIADLSRFRDLLVIASHSTCAYKGQGVKIQDVSRDLGVRYVLEGSVQRSADRVRITAQLIDGHTGGHLWAERYDRRMEDFFAVQDDVTERIVGTLASGFGGRLRKAWQGRAEIKRSENFQAFDCFMCGLDCMDHFTKENTQRARAYFEEAVRLDPDYAKAYGKLAWTYLEDAIEGWGEDYDGSLEKGRELATLAIERDDTESWGHWALAGYHAYVRRHDLALAGFERAMDLNPNDADVLTDAGYFLGYVGRAEDGLALALKAMRLNPHFPEYYLLQLGQLHFEARQYQEALAVFDRPRNLETAVARLYQAASHAALGQPEQAKEAIARALDLDPGATLEKWTNPRMAPYQDPRDLAHFHDNLRKAGLPA
jgi:TolB-like protein/Tfp pilus assembly protein PilF